MKRSYAGLAAVALVLLAAGSGLGFAAEHLANPALGKVRHVVLYAYKPDVTAEKQEEIARSSRELIHQIDLIRDLEWGDDLNAGARAQGYQHCLIMTFDSPEDVKKYVAHPAHQAFYELAKPYLDKLLVVDYVAKE